MPVLLGEFNTPEMWAGRKELNAYARALLRGITEIDHTRFLFLFSCRINEHQVRTKCERLIQIEQATMGIDNDCLAVCAKLPAFGVLTSGLDRDAREHAGTAPLACCCRFCHVHKYRALRP